MLCLCSAGAQQQGLQTYIACFCFLIMQTNGKISVPNAPKMAVLRYKIEKYPLRRLRRLESRAFGASILVPPSRGNLVPPADLELTTLLTIIHIIRFINESS